MEKTDKQEILSALKAFQQSTEKSLASLEHRLNDFDKNFDHLEGLTQKNVASFDQHTHRFNLLDELIKEISDRYYPLSINMAANTSRLDDINKTLARLDKDIRELYKLYDSEEEHTQKNLEKIKQQLAEHDKDIEALVEDLTLAKHTIGLS